MWEILHGDVLRVTKKLETNSFDAVLSDPPYGLSFMGRRWDYSVPSPLVWSEIERVMKPGAPALIFGGSRTFHRLMISLEDGGLDIRDLLFWLYGAGFPKGLNLSKAFDKKAGKKGKVVGYKDAGLDSGSGTSVKFRGVNARAANGKIPVYAPATDLAKLWAGYLSVLKPAYEPVALVQKFTEENILENAARYGVGALNIEPCRIGDETRFIGPADNTGKTAASYAPKASDNGYEGNFVTGYYPSNIIIDEEVEAQLEAMKKGISRMFYTAKADRYQREAGLEERRKKKQGVGALRDGERGAKEVANVHPTVKPVDLIRYLATLILPPKRDTPRRILVPYAGVSSEMIGCLQAGWDEVIGIEREAEYIEIAKDRITKGGVLSGLMDRKMRKRVSLPGGRTTYGKFAKDKVR